jgi:hypothetical protein
MHKDEAGAGRVPEAVSQRRWRRGILLEAGGAYGAISQLFTRRVLLFTGVARPLTAFARPLQRSLPLGWFRLWQNDATVRAYACNTVYEKEV